MSGTRCCRTLPRRFSLQLICRRWRHGGKIAAKLTAKVSAWRHGGKAGGKAVAWRHGGKVVAKATLNGETAKRMKRECRAEQGRPRPLGDSHCPLPETRHVSDARDIRDPSDVSDGGDATDLGDVDNGTDVSSVP
eukprot:gene15895-biopygen12692